MKHARLLAGAAIAALAAGTAQADEPFSVGFVYVGPVGDYGWTATHDEARLQVEEHFGDAVETSYVESVSEGADAERVMTQMALGGADMIFATSFGFGPEANDVAEQFPDVKFEHATGYQQDHDNISLYNARFYEGRAVMGHIAGRMTETNTIGYIASYPIPEVIMGINSAFIHAREANPDVEFNVIWLYSWFDPSQEADAANALIEQGADILMQHTDSTAPINIADDEGVYAFGQASDMTEFGPDAHLTALLDIWGPYYIERIEAAMEGSWEADNVWHGFADGMVDLAPFNDAIPEDVVAEAEELRASIESGEYHPFTGPLFNQDGDEVVPEGEVISDADLLAMDYYVEGMTAQLPD